MEAYEKPVYQHIAGLLIAIENCYKSNNTEWRDRHEQTLEKMVYETMPSGSGFDSGTKLDFERSNAEQKLIFHTSFHHMNDGGYYDGWTEHTVTVRPSLFHDIDIKISGRDRNEIKDYIHECFDIALRESVDLNRYTPDK